MFSQWSGPCKSCDGAGVILRGQLGILVFVFCQITFFEEEDHIFCFFARPLGFFCAEEAPYKTYPLNKFLKQALQKRLFSTALLCSCT